MKVKFLLFSTILTAIFLTSAIPSTKNSLRQGEEVEIFKTEILNENPVDAGSYIILNFWNPNDPVSRVTNSRMAKIAASNSGKLKFVSICTDGKSSLSDEILKIDGISGNGVFLNSTEISDDMVKVFQTSKGLRHFLLDSKGNLLAVSPDTDFITNLVGA